MELSNTRLSRLSQLRLKKHRDNQRLFIVEGNKCVTDLIGAFDVECIIATAEWQQRHPDTADVLTATPRQMDKLTSLSTAPDVMALCRMPKQPSSLKDLPRRLYIALDGIQDPGNLGTIVRLADWFGVDTVFASHGTADIYNAKAIQSTMGAIARVRVVYCDLPSLFADNPGMPVYGTLLEGRDIYESTLTDYGFVVMGNEGNGLSAEVRSLVTSPLLIPPYPADSVHTDSLNVAVATAITVAEFRRQANISH